MKPTVIKRLRRLLILLLIIYIAWCITLYFAQTALLYPRALAGAPLPDTLIPKAVERLWLDRPDGVRVESWLLRPPAAKPAERFPLVVYFHGNAELIDHCTDLVQPWLDRGYAFLLPEFRGYGRTGGSPREDAIVSDAVAACRALVNRPDIDANRIILHGRSLGAAVAVQVAEQLRGGSPPMTSHAISVKALIIESPFISVASFAWRHGIPPFLCTSPFHTDTVLPTLACPTLIISSREDEIIPFAHGERLHSLAPASTLIELSGQHNSDLTAQPQYWQAIDGLLRAMDDSSR